MVKCLNSYERSSFIEEYIGHPFSKNFDYNVRQCLVTNLCKEPYAGSLLILLIEYFDELHSTKRKTKQGDRELIVALGSTEAESEKAFNEIWQKCVEGIYPMEIQVLKETCIDKFKDFIMLLDKMPIKAVVPKGAA